ncbi:MAG: AMP-binding protein [Pseudonocardiaceae bacterium]|nr:AMP-binding protein [Pseudonocardiaceae bacterium]
MTIPFDEVEAIAASSLTFYEACERYPRSKPLRIYHEREHCTELWPDDLVRRVRALGSRLQRHCEPQERVVLLLPRIEDFVVGLLACFHANVVAVPTVVDGSAQSDAKAELIAAVVADCEASCLLVDDETHRWLDTHEAVAATFLTVSEQAGDDDVVAARAVAREDLAILMYTSGSESEPKGVVINHRTLVFQAAFASGLWEIGSSSTVVSWLAITHNFGLPLAVLTPLLTGAGMVLIGSDLFIQHPEYWFELIDRHGGTHTGATNSALELCVNSIEPNSLDISLASVISIFCAGEPIREQTLRSFTDKFADLGLRSDAVRPHYGLTEVGCLATESSEASPTVLKVDVEQLGHNVAAPVSADGKPRSLVRNGRVRGPAKVEIVDPETCEPCAPWHVGEVWFSSAATCQGYYGRPELNLAIFSATISTTGESGFFRTGDLGFMADGYLYLVGRSKELLIVNGMKFHPPDVETTLRKQIPEFALNTAVFSADDVHGDQVVLVQELPKDVGETACRGFVRRVRAVMSDYYGIAPHDIVFTLPGAVPRSGIGKVKRNACRDRYLAGTLPAQFRLQRVRGQADRVPGRDARRELVRDVLVPILAMEANEILDSASLGDLGCTSVQYIQVAKRVEDVFGIRLTPALLFKKNEIAALADHIAARVGELDVAVDGRNGNAQAPARPDRETGDGRAIAVIGMSCRFPGDSCDPNSFWRNLESGEDCVSRISAARPLLVADHVQRGGDLADLPESAGFSGGVDEFDAGFFSISPLEAQAMDPQQRKLMELTWHLFEDSGYPPSELRGREIGVYVGAHGNDYAELMYRNPELVETYGAYLDSGTHPALLANRVSRWYDLHGPSRVFNTACSSSLVALGAAVTDLRSGLCTEAVVGGVNTLLSGRSFACNTKAGMQAADGKCKTFDEAADGYVRGEGYGAVLLKPLAAAERDGDRILGVVRGFATNHDGQTDSLRAPSPLAQAALITAAYVDADIGPETVGYVEAHGTGTALGDPIEVQGLVDAFQELDPDVPVASCGLGSVKANIGHLESAAGIAGLIKLLLCMRHERLPGLPHFTKLNPFIELEKTPFRIVSSSEQWQRKVGAEGASIPLRAGLSSFGFGGANAHVLVEEYPSSKNPAGVDTSGRVHSTEPIVLSAHDEHALQALAERLLTHIDAHAPEPASLARSLRASREQLPERLAFEASSLAEISGTLDRYLAGERSCNGLHTGNIKQFRELDMRFRDDRQVQQRVRQCLDSGEFSDVLELWVKGLPIDWTLVDGGVERSALVPLPGYPFARERHWFSGTGGNAASASAGTAGLHPLVRENVSDLWEQRFRSHWTGQEFFLRDDIVRGKRCLSAATWLEAVRAAVALAHGEGAEYPGVRLRELTWYENYVHEPGAGPVEISLMVGEREGVEFDCYQRIGAGAADVRIFFQGSAELVTADFAEPAVPGDPGRATEQRGIDVRLPEVMRPTTAEFVAHPALLDALLAAAGGDGRAEPASADEALFLARCEGDARAVITERPHDSGQDGAARLDVDLRDDAGTLLVRLTGVRFACTTKDTVTCREGTS